MKVPMQQAPVTLSHTLQGWSTKGRSILDEIDHGERRVIARVDSHGRFLPGYDEAYAAHIVKCVNAHDALVEALRHASALLAVINANASRKIEDFAQAQAMYGAALKLAGE